MGSITINYVAVVLGAVSNMVIGYLWYSKMLFGVPWMKALGWTDQTTKDNTQSMGKTMSLAFLSALLTAYVMEHFIQYMDVDTVVGALGLAFWVWLGFVVTTNSGGVIFERRPTIPFYINIAYNLASLCAMAIILALM